MPNVPFHLRYTLSRSQRLIPLLGEWGLLGFFRGLGFVLFVVLLQVFFVFQAAAHAFARDLFGLAVFGGLAFAVFLLYGSLFLGILDVIRVPARPMDVIFEENAAGILIGEERWYLFLDGITDIRKYHDDTWTIRHWNGVVLPIAASAITDEQLQWIRSAMERGRTPEGVKAVIERGRLIEQIMIEERMKGEGGT